MLNVRKSLVLLSFMILVTFVLAFSSTASAIECLKYNGFICRKDAETVLVEFGNPVGDPNHIIIVQGKIDAEIPNIYWNCMTAEESYGVRSLIFDTADYFITVPSCRIGYYNYSMKLKAVPDVVYLPSCDMWGGPCKPCMVKVLELHNLAIYNFSPYNPFFFDPYFSGDPFFPNF